MPDHLGNDMRKVKNDEEKEKEDIKRKINIVLYFYNFIFL